MSRIGNTPINIPEDVHLTLEDNQLIATGPKGQLSHHFPSAIKVKQTGQTLTVTRHQNTKTARALHGLTRSLLANLITGVNQGYTQRLELVGTGYRVAKQGDTLVLSLGFSHPVKLIPKPGITLEIEGNNQIIVSGIDKQLVGQTAAGIRALKKPEPYKGKGIRYHQEVVRHKPGKATKIGAAAAA